MQIVRAQQLQREIRKKAEEADQKSTLLQEKEKLYTELRKLLSRQVYIDIVIVVIIENYIW